MSFLSLRALCRLARVSKGLARRVSLVITRRASGFCSPDLLLDPRGTSADTLVPFHQLKLVSKEGGIFQPVAFHFLPAPSSPSYSDLPAAYAYDWRAVTVTWAHNGEEDGEWIQQTLNLCSGEPMQAAPRIPSPSSAALPDIHQSWRCVVQHSYIAPFVTMRIERLSHPSLCVPSFDPHIHYSELPHTWRKVLQRPLCLQQVGQLIQTRLHPLGFVALLVKDPGSSTKRLLFF